MTRARLLTSPRLARAGLVVATALGLAPLVAGACVPATVESPAAACEAYADALCARLSTCSTTVIATRYGTMDACTSLAKASCEVTLESPSIAESPTARSACAAALPTWNCGDVLLLLNPPPACAALAGPGATGTPCSQQAQCASTFCSIPNGQQCGTCQPIPPPGTSCATAPCAPHDVCFGTEPTCLHHPSVNEQCQTPLTCAGGLACAGQSTSMLGTCSTSAATELGAPCDFTGAGCDVNHGVTCSASSGVCVPAVVAQPGGACNTVDDQQRLCAAASCVDGTCFADLGAGAPCQVPGPVPPLGVPTCAATLRCIATSGSGGAGDAGTLDGGVNGVCLPHTIADCSPQ